MGRSDCCKSHYGTTFRSKRWLALDPCGLLCLTFSFSIHIFSLYVASTHLISYSLIAKMMFGMLYVPASVLAISSLFVAWTTDPGAVPMGARPLPITDSNDDDGLIVDLGAPLAATTRHKRGIGRCRKCNDNYKPPRAHHDSVTGRCIVKMDHYCPWVCNAIGALNHKFFVLFIGYTCLTTLLSFILLVMRFVRCGYRVDTEAADAKNAGANIVVETGEYDASSSSNRDNHTDLEDWNGRRFIVWERSIGSDYMYQGCTNVYSNQVIVLFIVTVVFLIFTCCMLVEQFDAIESNTSKIARMKMKAGMAGNELTRVSSEFNEMFGTRCVTWHWFLPTPVKFPNGFRDKVMGYEWNATWDGEPYREPDDDRSCLDSHPTMDDSMMVPIKVMDHENNGTKVTPLLHQAEEDSFGSNIEISLGNNNESSKNIGKVTKRSSGSINDADSSGLASSGRTNHIV